MTEVPDTILPNVQKSLSLVGVINQDFAKDTGLKSGIPVISGGGDQAVQAFAQRVIEPGQLSVTIGTGGQILAPITQAVPDPDLRLHLFNHILPERWFLLGATLSAGLSLRWFRSILGGEMEYKSLADQAQLVTAAAEGLFFLPYLNGERTPWMNPEARASWVGLGLGHSQAHLTRAVMEGVVFSLKQALDIVIEQLPEKPNYIISSGGGNRHPLWLQLQADIFRKPICVREQPEAAVRGAAYAAALGLGHYESLNHYLEVTQKHIKEKWVQPGVNAERYQNDYQQYLRIFPLLKSLNGYSSINSETD